MEQIGDRAGAAGCAFNLGRCLPEPSCPPRSRAGGALVSAQPWELTDKRDGQGQAQCLRQLGAVGLSERYREVQKANQLEVGLRHLNAALQFCQQALDLLPPDAVNSLAATHNALGVIWKIWGDLDRALQHYSEAIRYEEMQDHLYGAAETRYNVAIAFASAGRLADAREYAHAALGQLRDLRRPCGQIRSKRRRN